MSEEESARDMAMALGMATFQAQALEYSLVSLHAATALKVKKVRLDYATIQSLMDTRYKKTLGKLIKYALRELEIPEELKEDLEDALEKRNWVIHHFFREYGAAGFSLDLQQKATKSLNEIWPFLEQVSNSVHDLVIQRIRESGKSDTEISNGIQRAIEKYIDEQTIT